MPQSRTTTHIAAQIQRRMDETRTNQTDFGSALGLSQSAVSRRLLGRIPFSLDELDKAAEVLGVPVSELFAEPAEQAK